MRRMVPVRMPSARERISSQWPFPYPCRNADRSCARGNVREHDALRADPRSLSDGDRSEYFRARPDDDSVAYLRMPAARTTVDGAERDPVKQQYIRAYDRRLAYDRTHSVIDKKARSDSRAGMNFYSGQQSRRLAD